MIKESCSSSHHLGERVVIFDSHIFLWLFLWLFVWLFFIIKESCSSSHHLGERVVIFDCMVVSMVVCMVVFHDQRELFI